MVTANDEILVVLSQAFVVQSNSTKVLLWLWLAFLLFFVVVVVIVCLFLFLLTLKLSKKRQTVATLIKGSVPTMRTRQRHLFFLQKTIELSY